MAEADRQRIKKLLHTAVTMRSKRDVQSSVGPSEIGQECDFCLGMALTRKYPEYRPDHLVLSNGFSLKAWTGTATHEHLETKFHDPQWCREVDFDRDYEEVLTEHTYPITYLDGYGEISGHVDLIYHTGWDYSAIVDHKTTDMDKLRAYRAHGLPIRYVVQGHLYGLGWHNRYGYPPVDVGFNFIPRDSNSADDIWVCFAAYDPRVAERALTRLSQVWQDVRAGKLESLERHSDCFTCTWKIYQQ